MELRAKLNRSSNAPKCSGQSSLLNHHKLTALQALSVRFTPEVYEDRGSTKLGAADASNYAQLVGTSPNTHSDNIPSPQPNLRNHTQHRSFQRGQDGVYYDSAEFPVP